MSKDTRVLIVGDPQDPVTQGLRSRCEQAECQVILHPDDQIYDLTTREKQHIVFYNFPPHCLAGQVFDRSVLSSVGVIFLSAYSDLAVGKLIPEHEPQVLAFSGLALTTDRPVLEIAPTLLTHPDTLDRGRMFLDNMGFKTYTIRETAGFVFPRVLAMLVNEAVSALMEGVASAEDIDTAMKLGTNYPQGPLAWADQVGLDVVLEILEYLMAQYGEDRYRPMPLLIQMVHAGKLGRKTGEGFYSYQAASTPVAPV